MTTHLVRYEAARAALAEAKRFDEVKDIRDKAVAMREYARQARAKELIEHATEIKLRAERRAGELLKDMKARGERDLGHGDRQSEEAKSRPATQLSDLGINKDHSSKGQKIADMDEESFEGRLKNAKRDAGAAAETTA